MHSKLNVRLLSAVALGGLILAGGASPDVNASTLVNFPDFSDVSSLQLNGSAAQVLGNRLRLTPSAPSRAGSAFLNSAAKLASDTSFHSMFSFQITRPGGATDPGDGVQGADGITFTIQTTPTGLGGAGGGIGYQGIGNSIAVEYDTWQNAFDPSGNHVGIDVNGNMASIAAVNIASPALNGGRVFWSWVDYDGLTNVLDVRLALSNIRPASPILSSVLNIPGILGTSSAYFGFSSGTGAAGNDHDLLSWRLAVPEPATLAIFGLGLAGLGVMRRRQRV